MSILERRAESKAKTRGPEPTAADLLKVYVTGFYFCVSCHRIIEPENLGEFNQCCPRCHSRRVKFCPPELPAPMEESHGL
jgi:DNA-directed RNA polymerase subunit RPC12/RpoP